MTGMFKVTVAKPVEGKSKAVYLIASNEDEALEMADGWYNRQGWIATDAEVVGVDALSNIFEVVNGELHEVRRVA